MDPKEPEKVEEENLADLPPWDARVWKPKMDARRNPKGFIAKLKAKAQKFYLNYSMITAVYMMEPLERNVINSIVILVLATMLYSTWVYLPHYTLKMLAFCGILSADGVLEADDLDNFDSNATPILES